MTPLASIVPFLAAPPSDATALAAPGGAEQAFVSVLMPLESPVLPIPFSDVTFDSAAPEGGSMPGRPREEGSSEGVAMDPPPSDQADAFWPDLPAQGAGFTAFAMLEGFFDRADTAQSVVSPDPIATGLPIDGPAIPTQSSAVALTTPCDDTHTPKDAEPKLASASPSPRPKPEDVAAKEATPVPPMENVPGRPVADPWLSLASESLLSLGASGAKPSSQTPLPAVAHATAAETAAVPTATAFSAPHPLPAPPKAMPVDLLLPTHLSDHFPSEPAGVVGEMANPVPTPAKTPGHKDTGPISAMPAPVSPDPAGPAETPRVAFAGGAFGTVVATPLSNLSAPASKDDRRIVSDTYIALPSGLGKIAIRAIPAVLPTEASATIVATPVPPSPAVWDDMPSRSPKGTPMPLPKASEMPLPVSVVSEYGMPLGSADVPAVDVPSEAVTLAPTAHADGAPEPFDSGSRDELTKPDLRPPAVVPTEVSSEKVGGLPFPDQDTASTAAATFHTSESTRSERLAPMARADAPVPTPQAQIAAVVAVAHDQTVELLLSPEELGQVRIDLRRDGETMVVCVSAERQDTLDLLRRNAEQLALDIRASSQSGVSLSFGRWTGSGGGSPGDGQTQRTDGAADSLAPQHHTPLAATARSTMPGSGLYLRI